MPNQFAMAGSQSQKQKARKYAPIWVNRFVSGYWPNRNPLRDASLPVLQEKFYGALNDALIDGQDCEINTRSELTRRPGNSVYNNNVFGAQQRFYSFPVFGNNGTPYRRVLASTGTQILDITGGTNDILLYTKPAGAQKTVFQAIGDTVFFADTITPRQLLSFVNVWAANTNFTPGINIADSNNNIQTNLGLAVQVTSVFISYSAGVGSLDITYSGPGSVISQNDQITFAGMTNATFLNGQTLNVYSSFGNDFLCYINYPANYGPTGDTGIAYDNGSTVDQLPFQIRGLTSNVLTVTAVNFPGLTVGSTPTINGVTTPNYTFLNGLVGTILSIVYSGAHTTVTVSISHANVVGFGAGYFSLPGPQGLTGGSPPTWSLEYNSLTLDGSTAWLNGGSAIRKVGITAPQGAPNVANTPAAALGASWVASTYYFPNQIMYDPVTLSLQQLTTAGTTNGSVPSFSATPGTTTTDGSAVWTSLGLAARTVTTTYAIGTYIMATWTSTIIIGYQTTTTTVSEGGIGIDVPVITTTPIYSTVTYSAFYQCSVAGISGPGVSSTLAWPLSGTIQDNTVTWTFIGLEVERTGSSSSSPVVTTSTFTPGNIGNGILVSLAGSLTTSYYLSQSINDGVNREVVIIAGTSGGSAPTWSKTVGGTTTDNGIVWSNVGSSGTVANTQNWFYAYAFVSSSTPDVSSASPVSIPIQRAASSWISLTGFTSSDPQVDTIRIYKTLLQPTSVTTVTGSQLFQLIDIPMPSTGTWQYVDTANDPPDPNSPLNTLVIADTTGINTPPLPQITNFVYYLGRLWGSVGNTIYASAGPDVVNDGNPFTAFPPSNFMDFPATIVRMIASSQGLMVYTSDNVQVITGNGVAPIAGESGFVTFVPNIYTDDISLGNYDGLTTDGSTTYIYTVDRNVVSLSSSGLTWISTAISNKLQATFTLADGTSINFDPTTSYLTWYVNGDDYGLLISDGTYGWFRMMPSTSPDAGNMVWSPFAKISNGSSGGISAVQYIETDITGKHDVLIGPGHSGTGPILKRDKTVNTDNGTTFSWYATFGSIVLAHPNEVAMIQSVVVDSVMTGSHPWVTVWFDEINSSGVNYTYTDYVNDPYTAFESTTTYADRFYMSDEPEAVAICRHLQLAVNFPAEDAANTVLSTTIIGATEYDN